MFKNVKFPNILNKDARQKDQLENELTKNAVGVENKKETGEKKNFNENIPLSDISSLDSENSKTTVKGEGFTFDKFAPPKRRFPIIIPLIFIFSLLILGLTYAAYRYKNRITPYVGIQGEIEWWSFRYDEEEIKPLIEKFEEENNIKVKYVKQSPIDYRTRLMSAFARGDGPDVFSFHNSWIPMFSEELDSLQDNILTKDDFVSRFYPVIVSDLNSPQGFLGIPLEYDALTLYINEDIFAKAAKTPPETWDQLKDLAKELTSRDKQNVINQAGVAIGLTENVDHWQEILALMLLQNGVKLANMDEEAAADAFSYFKSFSAREKIWDTTLAKSTTAFANGKVAMYLAPSYRAKQIIEINPGLRFRTYALPQVRKEDPEFPDISYATYWIEGVWKRSTDKMEAWKLLEIELFSNVKETGGSGFAYPRIDMGDLIVNDKYVGSVVAMAPNARSWYLAGDTNDGESGLNTQLSEVFIEILKFSQTSEGAEAAVKNFSDDIVRVLSGHGATK